MAPSWTLLVFASCLIFWCVRAQLPTPLESHAASSLYGADCSEWCLNGSVVLQPQVFGSTNAYCSDPRGCHWMWRMRIVPCSMALLAFDAEVGPSAVAYSTIDSAAHRALAFFCTESGSGATLEVRSAGMPSPLMQWRYQLTTCAALLGDLASAPGTFSGADTSVQLEAQQWFGSGAERLEASEVECSADARAVERPCEQCFGGVHAMALPHNASAPLIEACGYPPTGADLGDCELHWHLCYDVCSGAASHVGARLGSGIDVARVSVGGARATVRVGELAARGRTLIALTDAESVQALDAGAASFYLAWEYRQAPARALWQAPARDGLFVAQHLALAMRTGEVLASGAGRALGAYVWDGRQLNGIEAVEAAARSLSRLEAGLVAGLVVAVVAAVAGWAVAGWLACRRGRGRAQSATESVVLHMDSEAGGGHISSEWDGAVAAARQVLKETERPDMAHLYMDGAELEEHHRKLQQKRDAAQKLVERDYERRGGRLGTAVRAIPGGEALLESYREGQAELQAERMLGSK